MAIALPDVVGEEAEAGLVDGRLIRTENSSRTELRRAIQRGTLPQRRMVSRVASRAAAAAVGDEPVEQIRTATRTQVPGNHLPAMRQRMILIRMARKVATAARQVRRLNKNTARFPVGKMRSVWLSTQTWKPVRNHPVVKTKVVVGGVAVGLANRDLETVSGGGPAGLFFGRGSGSIVRPVG